MAVNQVAQLVPETLSTQTTVEVDVAQVAVETLSGISRELDVAQLVVETLSQTLWFQPPPVPLTQTVRDVLIEMSACRRALSGPDGDYETGSFTVTLMDIPRDLRRVISTTPGQYFLRRLVTVSMASLAAVRQRSGSSRRLAYGVVAEAPEVKDMSVTLRCVDFIGSEAWAGQ